LASSEKTDFDALILDLGLPDIDGLEVLTALRGRGWLGPVLVLTARDAVASRVEALDRGADDYLIKPFAYDELVARLRALIRRARGPRWAPLSCADVVLPPDRSRVIVGGRDVSLSPRERALLEALMRRQNEVVEREVILREAFGYEFDPGTNLIDVHLSHLRRKLAGSRVRIHTKRGVGFLLALAESEEQP
jgi:DNA-binding response OmpR family regulator